MSIPKRIFNAVLLTVGLTTLTLATGCNTPPKSTANNDTLLKENADLKSQRDKALADAQKARAERDRALAAAKIPADSHGPTGLEGEQGVTAGKNAQGEDQIELEGDVLFDSAKATIKPSFKKTLDKVAEVMKSQYAGRVFRVEGHTDPRPVRAAGWDDNWDLGAARARAVMLYLVSKGVPKKDFYIASFADNDLKSATDFALDRRVDIVVTK